MSVLNELGEYLEDNGIGTLGVDLFTVQFVDAENAPENQVVIKATGGPRSSTHEPKKEFTFQIIVRNEDVDAAEAKADDIRELLHTDDQTVNIDVELTNNGTVMMMGRAIQEPYVLGLDEKERFLVVANYNLLTRQQ